ncbi:MAG: alpha/beta fold hydrolase, partial [Steroidobacterales bacterium]
FTPFIETAVFDALDSRIALGFETFSTWPEITTFLSARFPTLSPEAIQRRARYGYIENGDKIVPLASKTSILATCRGLRSDLSRPLRELKIPASFICGGDSWVVSPRAVAATRALRPTLPFTVVEGSGHCVHEERPGLVVKAVLSLLDEFC